ncbi:Uncharacterised protein [Corynebacterium jeikeium]|nr:Uncharacterised protein [Corynebacterium jeikeium]
MVAPVGTSIAQDTYTPRKEPTMPITALRLIITTSRSVQSRAAAAGVISSASTRMFPTVRTDITTAAVTAR